MRTFLVFILIGFTSVYGAHRLKRAAYELPDALFLLQEPLKYTFVCERDGYFADQDNNCQVFHVCHTARARTYQYSFICGNLTIFNQKTLTCTYPEDAVPCERAHEYYYVNDVIGDPNAVFSAGGPGGQGGGGAGGGRFGPGGARGVAPIADTRELDNRERERILRELNRKFNELVEEGRSLDEEYAEIVNER